MEIERIIAERNELRAVVEAVNQVMRDEGYGQGELDSDLPGIIRAHIRCSVRRPDVVKCTRCASMTAENDRFSIGTEAVLCGRCFDKIMEE